MPRLMGSLSLGRPRRPAFSPALLGSLLKLFWDANDPYAMRFRGARQLKAAGSQYFRRQISAPFTFQQTSSQFTISMWIRLDGSGFPNPGSLIGVTGSSKLSWLFNITSSGGLQFYWGNTTDGTFAGQVTLSGNPFTNTSPANLFQCWTHVLIVYDGSQHGDDTKVIKVYVNGASTPAATGAAGSSLPQKVGNATDGSQQLTFGGRGFAGEYFDVSIADLAIATGVPTSNTTAAADLYNHGQGRRWPDWPSSCPTLLTYYSGDDNATDGGTAPSGTMSDKTGNGYHLAPINGAGGALQMLDWSDVMQSVRLQFGYNPVTGYRQRIYEAEYGATLRGGKPGVRCYGQRAFNGTGYDVGGSYGYAKFDGTTLGAGGSLFSSAIYNTLGSGENDYFGFSDDETNLGGSQGTRRFLTMNNIGGALNAGLDQTAGGRRFPNLHIHCASGNPLVYTIGPGDVNNLDGEEGTGHYVNGNAYV